MQMLVPRYLETSIEQFTQSQEKFREQMVQAFGTGPFGANPFSALEDQVRRNMELFERTFGMFKPFVPKGTEPEIPSPPSSPAREPAGTSEGGDIDQLRKQMRDMQSRLDQLSVKDGDKNA
jgi:polyhydroxyalkanoate synthesis regulator protein